VISKSHNGNQISSFVCFRVRADEMRQLDAFGADACDRWTHAVAVEGWEKHPTDAYVPKEGHVHTVNGRE
jgi:hypothetical protein